MPTFGPPPLLSHDDLIALLQRNFPSSWIDGLLSDPSSRSLFEGLIAAMLRVQQAGDTNLEIGAFILSALGRTHATCTVRLTRPSGLQVTYTAVSRLRDQRGGVWQPTVDTVIPASVGVQTVDVPITSQRAGYYMNTFQTPTFIFLDPPPDPNLVIIPGVDSALNGSSPFLDQHGKERKAFRGPNEADDPYRHRVLQLPDQVSPGALARTLQQVFNNFPSTVFLADLMFRSGYCPIREPFLDSGQPATGGVTGNRCFFYDVDFYDDVHGQQYRDIPDERAWIDVEMPTIADANAIATIADELDRKRGATIGVRILFGVPIALIRHPPDITHGGGVSAGTWTPGGFNSPPDLISAVQKHSGDDSVARTTAGAGAGAPASPNDLLYLYPGIFIPPLSVSFVRLVAWARRVVALGADPLFQFVVQPFGQTPMRFGPVVDLSTNAWQRIELILEQNPSTGAPWTVPDVSGFHAGVANVAAGATDEIRVSELYLELVCSYG